MKIVERICRVLNVVCYGACGIMMLLTVSDVLLRLFFKSPITGVTEISELLMLFLCWGMALATLENTHIRIDVLTNRLPPQGKAIGEIIRQVIGLGIIFILVWQTFKAGLYAKQYQVTSAMLQIPDWPWYMMLTLSFAILGISMIILIIRSVGVLRK